MDSPGVDRYLDRIACDRPEKAGLEELRQLQLLHLRSVPFENLSIHLGEPIVLNVDALLDKIVGRNRGGFCYELNGAFAALLRGLGYQVSMLAARVFGASGLGPPYDHMALRVDLDDSWLVDVGFGSFTHYPVRLDTGVDQADPAGTVSVHAGAEGLLDVLVDGRPQYRLDLRPAALADFIPTCWWQATSPDSHFTRSLTCSRLTERGRVTLSGRRLIVTEDGARREEILGSDEEVLEAYKSRFGIELDRLPQLGA